MDSNDILFLSNKYLELDFKLLEFDRIFSDKPLKLAFKLLDEIDRNDLILSDKDLECDVERDTVDELEQEANEDEVKTDELVNEDADFVNFLGSWWSSSHDSPVLGPKLPFDPYFFPNFLAWIFLACN